MGDFTPSDKLVIAVIAYLVLVTVMEFVLVVFHPELHTREESDLFGNFVEFVLGAVIGYVGGRSE